MKCLEVRPYFTCHLSNRCWLTHKYILFYLHVSSGDLVIHRVAPGVPVIYNMLSSLGHGFIMLLQMND